MPHSQSYPVTVVNLPQPHVEYATKKEEMTSLSGWCVFILAGVVAMTFMVTIHYFGGTTVFLTVINTSINLIPIVKQGVLKVYPSISGVSNGIETTYTVNLPSNETANVVTVINNLIKGYPTAHGEPYRNCWLENPGHDSPCFYDVSWITPHCTSDNSFGFQEKDGYYNPCFILKIDDTTNWTPLLQPKSQVPSALHDNYDAGFMPIDCYIRDFNTSVHTTVYPPKGFSHMYFPMSKFNSSTYLPPLLAVKVFGIQRGQSVSLTCSIITPNAFLLHNNGRVTIKITAN